ncbi:MAG: HdeA/HdeB family chaperone [Pseudomonadota bacterium]
MYKFKYATAPALAFVLCCALAPVSALAQRDERDLDNIECREIMILSGLDRDTAIAFMHGYLVGQSDETTFQLSRLTEATEIFLDDCLDKPDTNAVSVMKDALQRVP